VPTNQQRRDAERRRLQKQLEERRAREAARKRTTLIASIVGTVVLIAAVVIVVVVTTSGSDKKKPAAAGGNSPSTTQPSNADTVVAPPDACQTAPKGSSVSFDGVTVGNATDLKKAPQVKSLSEQAPNKLECMDLVVGKGKPATPTSTVSVQYTGVLYKDGTQFDSSWDSGQPVSFPLTGVVKGFTQGIGGYQKVAPMREGGRRIMILPAALGYGPTGKGSIPGNAPLVFVVDLKSVSAGS
jgi:FKBP-type peptidyl-prolyl cis-trans isomerase